jgi:formate dehydrogenase (NADP+) beta subunit
LKTEIKMNIDGKIVSSKEGKSVLESALENGIYIPNICYHPNLRSTGDCKLCMVEVDGIPEAVTACTTPATEGMVVKTKSAKLDEIRRTAMGKLLTNHPSECTTCPKYLNCELQALKQYLGVNEGTGPKRTRVFPLNTSNPLFVHDFSRCIMCGRCVRACQELRGAKVLSLITEGGETYVGTTADRSLIDSGCRFCGTCVDVCPTGALRDQDKILEAIKGRRAALVSCKFTCPAGIDVPRYVRFIREKNYPAAAAVIREKVPFPGVLGYVCNHACEGVCRHGEINEAISIKELKRFAAERDDKSWKKNSRQEPATGKRVAIVGSGPAGLTAAYYLAKLGHSVTVFESLEAPGGMLRFGIPEYRLPTQILNEEIKEIESSGVQIRTNTKIESLDKLFDEGFNAILVAVGTHNGQKLNIPGADLEGVLLNIPFLRDMRRGKPAKVGKRVVVLGGGNVAFDCARTALRLGAADVSIACLEPRDKMTATDEDISEGCEEGIKIFNSCSFVKIAGENGKVSGVECLNVKSFEFDDEGQLNLECDESSSHILPADTVIFAVGQRPEVPDGFSLTTGRGNTIQVEYDNVSTGREGVFAAGDAVTGTSHVIKAIAAGRQAAQTIDGFLGGSGTIDEVLAPVVEPNTWLGSGEGFACRTRPETVGIPVTQRLNSSSCGVSETYSEENAVKESERCLQCDLRLKVARMKFWADY